MAETEYLGHRQRLRERFLADEAGSHSDEALLELLLTFAIERKDVKPLAQELIRVFGRLSQVLSAPPDALSKVKGVGQSSIVLLKVIDFIRSVSESQNAGSSQPKGRSIAQLSLFEGIQDEQEVGQPLPKSRKKGMGKKEGASTPALKKKRRDEIKPVPAAPDMAEKILPVQLPGKKTSPTKKVVLRKFQVSNGYLLEFDQLARILHLLAEKRDARKISRKAIVEETGLADRHVEALISMGAAMGLIQPGMQVLTPTGLLIAKYDIFIEKKGTLEWCHYVGAGSYRNLVWFEVFNHLLAQSPPRTQEEWIGHLSQELEGDYSKKTIANKLYKEVRFITDAYLDRNFNKLGLLDRSTDGRLYRRRYTDFDPIVLNAMIYDFCGSKERQLLQINEMADMPGSPAAVFGLDAATFRQQVERLHDQGWLRYETTHNLDQIRLKPSFSAFGLLTDYFGDHKPLKDSKPSIGAI